VFQNSFSKNQESLNNIPDTILPAEIKDLCLKVKKGIIRRTIESQARDGAKKKWTIPYIKGEIVKMGRMERIELIEYKRSMGLQFYKSNYSPSSKKTLTNKETFESPYS
jgi:hypothetical protein